MGIINVYTGPMKCGKSQKIFNELKSRADETININRCSFVFVDRLFG